MNISQINTGKIDRKKKKERANKSNGENETDKEKLWQEYKRKNFQRKKMKVCHNVCCYHGIKKTLKRKCLMGEKTKVEAARF